MGLRINTNTQSLQAQNSLKQNVKDKSQALAKLSSGRRINKASDDAAGLAISEKLKANIRGANQARRNAGDGISMVQTAEGGLQEISNILIRMRELSIQSASDTVGDNERKFTDLEYQQLTEEIDRIANTTKFNGIDLINGKGEEIDIQVGVNNVAENDRIAYSSQETDAQTESLGVDGLHVASQEQAQENLEQIDQAMNKVNGSRATLGALQNRLQSTDRNIGISVENMSAANSRIRDTDVAQASSELARGKILTSAGTSVLAQANVAKQQALKLIG